MISPAGKDDRGFTLLELLAVLFILSLASLIVLPSLERGLRERQVRRSALGLAAVARDLRAKALYGNGLQRLVFNRQENSYQVWGGEKVVLSSEVRIAGVEGGEPLGEGSSQFLFFPNGSLFAGEVEVSDQRGYPTYVVSFEPLTGRIAVVRSTRP